MKLRSIFQIFLSVCVLGVLVSCENDDDKAAKPKVNLTELGLSNSKVGYIGKDLHVEAEIVAQGKIEKITIEIHPEGEEHHSEAEEHDDDELKVVYTEFKGLKNATFHKHVDIPESLEPGDYHFHFEVVDMEGNQTLVEEELKIEKVSDTEAPKLTVKEVSENTAGFKNGEVLTVKGIVTDNNALGGMFVGLVRGDKNITDDKVNPTSAITLLHTHDFTSPASHNFTATITIGAKKDNNGTPKDLTDSDWAEGSYYLLVKCKDAVGNWTFSKHYPVQIVK